MALPDWVIIGGIVGTTLTSVVAIFRVKPEVRKLEVDGAAGLTTSAGAIVSAMEHEMRALRGELADIRPVVAEVRELRAWRRRVEIRGRRHSQWDAERVDQARARGEHVPDPPPLFDDEEEVSA